MKARATLACGLALAVALSGGAAEAKAKSKRSAKPRRAAAVKPVCNLVGAGSGKATGVDGGSDDSLAITGGDVATNASLLTGVIRLKAAPTGSDTGAPLGRDYYLEVSVPKAGKTLFLQADVDPLGTVTYTWGDKQTLASGNGNYNGDGVASGALVGNELHVTVPLSVLAAQAKIAPGETIVPAALSTYLLGAPSTVPAVGGDGIVETADQASGKPYVAGTPSCIRVGV